MNERVTILVSGGGASEKMLRMTLNAIQKYKNYTNYFLIVLCPVHQCEVPVKLCNELSLPCHKFFTSDDQMAGSKLHAEVLDSFVPNIKTPLMLTMDADCFPIADGWLDTLVGYIDNGNVIAGIAHPYKPPDDTIQGIERRIRSQLCWRNTHVACQLIRMDVMKDLGVKFSDGDDTGLEIVKRVRDAGFGVRVIMPNRCALPNDGSGVDPEFNRTECVVFGDMIYHHGGGSREEQSRGQPTGNFSEARSLVMANNGAEHLLQEGMSHKYKFEREEEVADMMTRGIIRGMLLYLKENDSLFME